MATLPQLFEEDVQQLDLALRDFLARADATAALVIDKGGFLLAHHGVAEDVDFTTLGALAAGAFMANQTIAGLVNEKNFNSLHQQGDKFGLYIADVDEHCLLVVIFPSASGVGVVKYYATGAVKQIAAQLAVARDRDPGGGLDLSELNVADPQELFRKKAV
jgi:predicted regulator of Ras-like GTPase activity (Roadblock/LC7/MglB family)